MDVCGCLWMFMSQKHVSYVLYVMHHLTIEIWVAACWRRRSVAVASCRCHTRLSPGWPEIMRFTEPVDGSEWIGLYRLDKKMDG